MIPSNDQNRVHPLQRHEADRATAAFRKTITCENRLQVVDQISNEIVLYGQQPHAITLKYFAVEHIDNLEQLPQIAASLAEQQDVAGIMHNDVGALT